jgi:hypothetical protein
MTIEQTVEIPDDRRIFFEFLAPKEIPAGLALVELKLTPVTEKPEKAAAKKEGNAQTPRADRLLGIAANLGDISLEEIREERLAKYLKNLQHIQMKKQKTN